MAKNSDSGASEFINPNSHPAVSQRMKNQSSHQLAPESAKLKSESHSKDPTLALSPATGDGEGNGGKPEEPEPAPEPATQNAAWRGYSNEARVYHARYDALSEDHDNGAFYNCREGCKDLLTEPNLPRYTRVQTLQMLSTLLKEPGAERCLHEAAVVLDQMDADKWQVALLKNDNEKMLADLQTWRAQEGLLGADLEQALLDREDAGTGALAPAASQEQEQEDKPAGLSALVRGLKRPSGDDEWF